MQRKALLRRIEAQIRTLQAKAQAIRDANRPGIRELQALIKKHGLGLHEFELATGKRRRSTTARAGAASKLKGRKIKPKYRNPADRTQTWTGRGRQPAWVQDALRKGKTLEQLAI